MKEKLTWKSWPWGYAATSYAERRMPWLGGWEDCVACGGWVWALGLCDFAQVSCYLWTSVCQLGCDLFAKLMAGSAQMWMRTWVTVWFQGLEPSVMRKAAIEFISGKDYQEILCWDVEGWKVGSGRVGSRGSHQTTLSLKTRPGRTPSHVLGSHWIKGAREELAEVRR